MKLAEKLVIAYFYQKLNQISYVASSVALMTEFLMIFGANPFLITTNILFNFKYVMHVKWLLP